MKKHILALAGILFLAVVVLAASYSVDLGPDKTVLRSDAVSFDCKTSAGFGAVSYFWDFGDGKTQWSDPSSTVQHVYNQRGVFTVRCDAYSISRQKISGTVHVTVLNHPPEGKLDQPNSVDSKPYEINFNYRFTDPDGNVSSAMINFGDGRTTSLPITADVNGNNARAEGWIKHTYQMDGVYSVTATATDNDGASVSKQAYAIIAKGRSAAGDWVNAWLYQPNSTLTLVPQFFYSYLFFSNDDFNVQSLNCSWDFGDGTGMGGCNLVRFYDNDGRHPAGGPLGRLAVVSANHSYLTPGARNAKLDVAWNRIDGRGQVRQRAVTSVQAAVTAINRGPHVLFNNTQCKINVTCMFDASASSDDDGTIVLYSWDFGDGTPALGQSVAHKYTNTSGPTTVKLSITDNSGATNSTSRLIDVQLPAEFVDQGTGLSNQGLASGPCCPQRNKVAQSFVPNVSRLERFKVKVGGASAGYVEFRLRSSLDGIDIANATLDYLYINSFAGNYVPVPFHVDVTPGSTYYVVMRPFVDNQLFYFHNGDAYPAGSGYLWNSGTAAWSSFNDTAFQTTYFA